MLFTDPLFLLLLAATWGGACLLRPWPAVKEWFLIGVSLLLIATWGCYGLFLFLSVLLVNYAGASVMVRVSISAAKRVLTLLIAADLATLVFFKYSNFLGQNVTALSGVSVPHFPLGIPLAISFYTFHLISYLVDLRKGKVRLATFREYLFYLSFFPHVIAGPIVRVWQLVPQIGRQRRVKTDLLMGVHLLAIGFFLKSAVANNIAQAIDPIWAGQGGFPLSACDRWVVAFLYYCQIYGDFAGYSLMALGTARLLGYRLPPNFRAPMLASSLQEFWTRWHITLSRWLRDYLYIPLGGSRVAFGRSLLNLFITMLLGGLWHGAGWGFVIWGAMHGAGLALERLAWSRPGAARDWRWTGDRLKAGEGVSRPAARFIWPRWILTQGWILMAWVFFRAPDFSSAWSFLWHLAPVFDHWYVIHRQILGTLVLAVPVTLHHAVPYMLRKFPRRYLGLALGGVTGLVIILDCVITAPAKTFIYFKF